MSHNSLQDIEAKRRMMNRRIGVYSIWLILIGAGLALVFLGEGMEPEKRWGILALVIVYVAARLLFMRRKAN